MQTCDWQSLKPFLPPSLLMLSGIFPVIPGGYFIPQLELCMRQRQGEPKSGNVCSQGRSLHGVKKNRQFYIKNFFFPLNTHDGYLLGIMVKKKLPNPSFLTLCKHSSKDTTTREFRRRFLGRMVKFSKRGGAFPSWSNESWAIGTITTTTTSIGFN
jgi:hypothetical protein